MLVMREAVEADVPAIIALLADDALSSGREDPSLPLDPRYLAAFRALDASPDQMLVVAEIDGRIVGTQQLSFLPGLSFRGAWRGQIEGVRIAADLRGRGLGGAMIDWAVEECRKRGCALVQLTSKNSRTDAHRFYERLGWAKSHTGFKLKLADDITG